MAHALGATAEPITVIAVRSAVPVIFNEEPFAEGLHWKLGSSADFLEPLKGN